jgi:hypothetical protein
MAILNSEHLIEQAENLIAAPRAGPPRQVDLRRAISSAYYGLFHYTLRCVADEFVGATQRSTPSYALVYRAVDHRAFRDLCAEVLKQRPSQKYTPYLPVVGLGPDIRTFAGFAIELQEKRHFADYSPLPRFRTSDAKLAIELARVGVQSFSRAPLESRKVFLALLLCPPR